VDLVHDRTRCGVDVERRRDLRVEAAGEELLDALHGEDVEEDEGEDRDVGDAERRDPVERDAARARSERGGRKRVSIRRKAFPHRPDRIDPSLRFPSVWRVRAGAVPRP